MKKILACLLAFMMLTTPVKAAALQLPWTKASAEAAPEIETTTETEEGAEAAEEAALEPLTYDYEELVVGTTMPMYGEFFTSMWGNGSSDIDVRDLIHGYNLVEWDSEVSGFQLDPSVVTGHIVRENAAGDHTYTLFISDDLKYSDGSDITAWDYAFSYLLRMAPQIAELGGTPEALDYIGGYRNYMSGAVRHLTGVHVVSDTQMTITISNEILPFFFELALLDCNPYPISVIAPGCEVQDDGDGVYISGPFNAELLRSTLTGENGYAVNPSVTSGPYRLVSFDGTEARFELNEYYNGDSDGARPNIDRIVFRAADPKTMVSQLMNCEYGLLNKATVADLIQEGMDAISEDPRFTAANYPRSGLSFIAFNTERDAGASEAVRKAIAFGMDRQSLVNDAVSNYGLEVNGYYGLGQWMYQLLNGTIGYPVEEPDAGATVQERQKYERDLAKWEALTADMEGLATYAEQDVDKAISLLQQDGWTLNRNGEAYNPETDDVRCKQINGAIVPLDLKLVYADGASIGTALGQLVDQLKAIGINLTVEGVDQLLELYYGQREGDWDMLFVATDFNVLFEPSPQFEPNGEHNYFGVNDDRLYSLAQDMIRTEPGDLLSYCEKWLAFQMRFNEVEPVIPVYSNIYFDFYPRVLQEYAIADYSTWAHAIVPAYMADIPEEEEVAEEEDVFLD